MIWEILVVEKSYLVKQGGVTPILTVLPSVTAVKALVKSQVGKIQQVKGQASPVSQESTNSNIVSGVLQSIRNFSQDQAIFFSEGQESRAIFDFDHGRRW